MFAWDPFFWPPERQRGTRGPALAKLVVPVSIHTTGHDV